MLLTAATQALDASEDLGSSLPSLRRRDESSSLSSSTSSLNSDGSGNGAAAAFEATVDDLLQEHLDAVEIAVTKDADLRQRLEMDVRGDCDRE